MFLTGSEIIVAPEQTFSDLVEVLHSVIECFFSSLSILFHAIASVPELLENLDFLPPLFYGVMLVSCGILIVLRVVGR